jgi:hypothetical protein
LGRSHKGCFTQISSSLNVEEVFFYAIVLNFHYQLKHSPHLRLRLYWTRTIPAPPLSPRSFVGDLDSTALGRGGNSGRGLATLGYSGLTLPSLSVPEGSSTPTTGANSPYWKLISPNSYLRRLKAVQDSLGSLHSCHFHRY